MFDTVLRVFADDFDVESFLASVDLGVPSEAFKKGENDVLGNPNPDSGFDALVSENEDLVAHLDEIRVFLAKNVQPLTSLKAKQVTAILDMGFTVGADEQFTQSIKLPADLLGELHQLNISVEISAYPGSQQ